MERRPQVMAKVFNLTRSCFLERCWRANLLWYQWMVLAASRDHYSYPLHAAVTEFHPLRPVWSLVTCAQLHKSIKAFIFDLKTQITYCLPGSFLPVLTTLVLKKKTTTKKPEPQLQIIFKLNLVSRTTSLEVVMTHPTSPKIFFVTQTPSAYRS